MKKAKSGGGWQALLYTAKKANQVGWLRLWKAMRSKNACKTCALGMGGQLGGMTNEARHFPEVCKKSLQAMTADMQGCIGDGFWSTYTIDQLRGLSPRELEHCGRLSTPVVARPGSDHYEPISWDAALRLAAEELGKCAPDRMFLYCSGRSSNEAGFLLNLLARALGTNHLSNCSYYCHQASGVGLGTSIGRGTATVSLEDLEACDTLFLIGGNPASNHPRMMTSLMKIRNRGGKIVVVNPVREVGLVKFKVPSNVRSMMLGTEIANLYIQPKIGSDIALFIGIAKILIEQGSIDAGYIEANTEGFSEVKTLADTTPWEAIEKSTGVARKVIEEAASVYAKSERTVFAWTMGITHHVHGVENVRWITNLALMRGMVGKPGAGLLPIRGHSNVQGLGTVGVTPTMREHALERLAALGIRPPSWPGYDTLAAMEAAGRGQMDFAMCLGGNLFGASPDADFNRTAMSRLSCVVYLSTTLNSGHLHGMGKSTIILPVKVRDEESQTTTQESMFNYVRLSDGGAPRLEGPKSEVDVLASIAEAACPAPGTLDWRKLRSHDEIRRLIADLIPPLKEIADIGATKKEFQIPGRVLHSPKFATESGKAKFWAHELLPTPDLRDDELLLMTVRSEGQFNTVVYEEHDLYRGQDRRDVILMNPQDRARMGLRVNQAVKVEAECGSLEPVLVRDFDIAKGCALMYYPEANALISRAADPLSKTPAFKAGVVRVVESLATVSELADQPSAPKPNLQAC